MNAPRGVRVAYWNYRMTVQLVDGEESWDVRELYYDADDNVVAWTTDHVGPHGDTVGALRSELAWFQKVAAKPAFDLDTRTWRESGARRVPPQPELFEPVGTHGRVRCTVCGTRGYPGGSWQKTHRLGHASCPRCGRMLQVKLDGSARTHTRCPRRP